MIEILLVNHIPREVLKFSLALSCLPVLGTKTKDKSNRITELGV